MHFKDTTEDSKVWIKEVEDIWNQMDEIGLMQAITNKDFMLHVMGNV